MAITRLRIYFGTNEDFSGREFELRAPPGYEFTGEYRCSSEGEYVLGSSDEALQHSHICNLRFFILRPIESAKERRARRITSAAKQVIGFNQPYEAFAESIERIFAQEKG